MFRDQNLRRAGDNFRCLMCVRGVVAMPRRLEVGEEIVNSFRYLGDVISCGGDWRGRISNKG